MYVGVRMHWALCFLGHLMGIVVCLAQNRGLVGWAHFFFNLLFWKALETWQIWAHV